MDTNLGVLSVIVTCSSTNVREIKFKNTTRKPLTEMSTGSHILLRIRSPQDPGLLCYQSLSSSRPVSEHFQVDEPKSPGEDEDDWIFLKKCKTSEEKHVVLSSNGDTVTCRLHLLTQILLIVLNIVS
jgi:hypothetical protein